MSGGSWVQSPVWPFLVLTIGSHMEKCIFIGYPEGYKGWMFYNPTIKRTIISERAEFVEGDDKTLETSLTLLTFVLLL